MASQYRLRSYTNRKRKHAMLDDYGSGIQLGNLMAPIYHQERGGFSLERSQFPSLLSPLRTQRPNHVSLFSLLGLPSQESALMFQPSGTNIWLNHHPTIPLSGVSVSAPFSAPMLPYSLPEISAPFSDSMPLSIGARESSPATMMTSLYPQHGRVQNISLPSFTPNVNNNENQQMKAPVSDVDEQLKTVNEFYQFLNEISIPTNMADDLSEEYSYIPFDPVQNTIFCITGDDLSEIDEMNNWWEKVYNNVL